MKTADIAIIGLGSFGSNVLKNFYAKNIDVTIIDTNETLVNQYTNMSSSPIVANGTDENIMRKIGIQNYDCVVVAIGQDLNASILTTLVLVELGVKNIIVKASDENHAKILKRVGASEIIFPDSEIGERVVTQILYNSMTELVKLNECQSMSQVIVSSDKFINKPLSEIDFTNKYNILIAAITRFDEVIIPTATETLKKGDKLIVIGNRETIIELVKEI